MDKQEVHPTTDLLSSTSRHRGTCTQLPIELVRVEIADRTALSSPPATERCGFPQLPTDARGGVLLLVQHCCHPFQIWTQCSGISLRSPSDRRGLLMIHLLLLTDGNRLAKLHPIM